MDQVLNVKDVLELGFGLRINRFSLYTSFGK